LSPVAHRFSVWAYNARRKQWELQGTSRTLSNAERMAKKLAKRLPAKTFGKVVKTKVVDREQRGGGKAVQPKAKRRGPRTPLHKRVNMFGRKGVFIDWGAWTKAKEVAAHNIRELKRVERLVEAAKRHTRLLEDKLDAARKDAAEQARTLGGITDTAEQTARIVADPAFWRMIKDAGVELSIEEKRRRALLNAGYGLELIEREQLLTDKDKFLTALRAAGSTWHNAYQAWFGYA